MLSILSYFEERPLLGIILGSLPLLILFFHASNPWRISDKIAAIIEAKRHIWLSFSGIFLIDKFERRAEKVFAIFLGSFMDIRRAIIASVLLCSIPFVYLIYMGIYFYTQYNYPDFAFQDSEVSFFLLDLEKLKPDDYRLISLWEASESILSSPHLLINDYAVIAPLSVRIAEQPDLMIDLLFHFRKELVYFEYFINEILSLVYYGSIFPFADFILFPILTYLFSILVLFISIIMTTILIRLTIIICSSFDDFGLFGSIKRFSMLIIALIADFLIAIGMTLIIIIVIDNAYSISAMANDWVLLGVLPGDSRVDGYVDYIFRLLNANPAIVEEELNVVRSNLCTFAGIDCVLLRESVSAQDKLGQQLGGFLHFLYYKETYVYQVLQDSDRLASMLGLGYLDDPLFSRFGLLLDMVFDDLEILFSDGVFGILANYRLVDFDSAQRNWLLGFSLFPLILHSLIILFGIVLFIFEIVLIIAWRPLILILEKEGLFKTLGAYSLFLITLALYIFR